MRTLLLILSLFIFLPASPQVLRASGAYNKVQMAGGGGFSPDDIAEIEIWLYADVGITITGAGVSEWLDQSGNSLDATQSTDSYRPTNPAAIINGHKVVRFDGVDNFLSLPTGFFTPFSSGAAFTFFIVFSIDDDSDTRQLISSCDDENPNRFGLDAADDVLRACCMTGSWEQENFSNSNYVEATFHIAMVRWNITGPASELTVDDVPKNGTVDHTQPSSLGCFIGALDGGSAFLDGDIAEIVGYSKILSSGEEDNVMDYLNTKYNIY